MTANCSTVPSSSLRCASTASPSRTTTARSAEGLYLPDDAATNPARRAVELATRLRDRARLHERTTVLSIQPGRVVTSAGTVFAPRVLVAVDGRLELLVPALAGTVRTARLQMLATSPVRDRLPCPVVRPLGLRLRAATARRPALRRRRARPLRGGRVDDRQPSDRGRAGLHRDRRAAHGRRAAGRRHAPLGRVRRLHRRRPRGRRLRSTTASSRAAATAAPATWSARSPAARASSLLLDGSRRRLLPLRLLTVASAIAYPLARIGWNPPPRQGISDATRPVCRSLRRRALPRLVRREERRRTTDLRSATQPASSGLSVGAPSSCDRPRARRRTCRPSRPASSPSPPTRRRTSRGSATTTPPTARDSSQPSRSRWRSNSASRPTR